MIEEKRKDYFFKKGNKFGGGAPPSSRKQMEIIRRRILMVVRRRLMHEKDLNTVSTTDLIKFLGTIMPKDYSLAVRPEVNYISNVPRDDEFLPEPEPVKAIIEGEVVQEEAVLEEQPITTEAVEEPSISANQ